MLDEWKLRYKEAALWKRMLLCALLGLIPAALMYFDETTIIDEDYSKAEAEEKAAANKLLQADNTLKNLAKVESELAFTREQLKKAESRLPDSIAIDEILRTVGKSAKEFRVNVRLFEPKAEVLRGDSYKYSELPIKVSVEAHEYSQLCEWLDNLAGSKSKIYLKSWKITRRLGKPEGDQNLRPVPMALSAQESPSVLAEREGRINRENMLLVMDAEVSLYKMPSAAQLAVPVTPVDPKNPTNKPNDKKSGKDGKKSDLDARAKLHRDSMNLEKGAA